MNEQKFLLLQFISTSNTRGPLHSDTTHDVPEDDKNKELDKLNIHINIKFKSEYILEISTYLKFERRKYTKSKYIFRIVK